MKRSIIVGPVALAGISGMATALPAPAETPEVFRDNAPKGARFATGSGVPECSMNDSITVLSCQT